MIFDIQFLVYAATSKLDSSSRIVSQKKNLEEWLYLRPPLVMLSSTAASLELLNASCHRMWVTASFFIRHRCLHGVGSFVVALIDRVVATFAGNEAPSNLSCFSVLEEVSYACAIFTAAVTDSLQETCQSPCPSHPWVGKMMRGCTDAG